ncbi:helix-turn-helix domain-containing protein [Timonella senegalensis]|uniref:helix-turn-helix domain-containing protein n=1 Tax=Timonella senegalensis TaxID=1465825 RepID=UPI0028AC1400|nr:helix-turn-helix transcriptional regulator [Timonella senegalensis]
MSTRHRAERFAQYVGLELKGTIIARGFTAKQVSELTGRSPAAFNRWINGKAELPIVALSESCEVIGIEPNVIVENAYARMIMDFGELDGTQYEDEAAEVIGFPQVPQIEDSAADKGDWELASYKNDGTHNEFEGR